MITSHALAGAEAARLPFAGADVCREAGLPLPERALRPLFDDDLWDLSEVIGLPVSLGLQRRRFDFTRIADARWRLVAKELVMALLAPHHEAVAALPRAYRTPHHVSTCNGRLDEIIRFMAWLPGRGVDRLEDLTSADCDAYHEHRRYPRDDDGIKVGERGASTRRLAALIVTDLLNYRELFTTDRVPAGLRPWAGAAPSAIAGDTGHGGRINKTQPVPDEVFRPALAAALHLVRVLGPHAAGLAQEIRDADRGWSTKTGGLKMTTVAPVGDIRRVLGEYERAGRPLPVMRPHHVQDRIEAGWPADDPLTTVAFSVLARQAGVSQFYSSWLPVLRGPVEATLKIVGSERPFGRAAALVPLPGDGDPVRWTRPLHREEAVSLIQVIRTAVIITLAAVTGMRASELMELQAGCRQPPRESVPGLARYLLSGTLVKGQPLGGVRDEWVVIREAYDAAGLAEQLHGDPRDGEPLLGRFHFGSRYERFRDWVNGPGGQRLGLDPIPEGNLNLRMLRRKLAIELAYRPGGLLAAKIYLHHVSDRGRVRVAAGRSPGRAPGRGQQSRAGTQPGTGDGRVPELPAGQAARRARRPQPDRLLRQHRRQAGPVRGPQSAAQRPGRAQPAGQAFPGASPRPGKPVLVHRSVPRSLPQAGRHSRRRPAADRNVRLGTMPAGHSPFPPPAGLGRARRADQDLPRTDRRRPQDRAHPAPGRLRPGSPRDRRDRRRCRHS